MAISQPTEYGAIQMEVRKQIVWVAVWTFRILLPAVLVALAVVSIWTAVVNVSAMRGYLIGDVSDNASIAIPIAVQTAILAGEATMLLDAVLRRWWLLMAGALMSVSGYTVEIVAHVQHSNSGTWALIVAAVACGGGWALMSALAHRGVQVANEMAVVASSLVEELDQEEQADARDEADHEEEDERVSILDAHRDRRRSAAQGWWALQDEKPDVTKKAYAEKLNMSRQTLNNALDEFPRADFEDEKPARDVTTAGREATVSKQLALA
ncbi:hypothetical protein ACFXPT_11635 [Streptomyces goshikiensis]|uniref:hypothetical protein n=1 Tax=Streptomyces goshikiensis TaxID=1942 RepID=UPI003695E9BC